MRATGISSWHQFPPSGWPPAVPAVPVLLILLGCATCLHGHTGPWGALAVTQRVFLPSPIPAEPPALPEPPPHPRESLVPAARPCPGLSLPRATSCFGSITSLLSLDKSQTLSAWGQLVPSTQPTTMIAYKSPPGTVLGAANLVLPW